MSRSAHQSLDLDLATAKSFKQREKDEKNKLVEKLIRQGVPSVVIRRRVTIHERRVRDIAKTIGVDLVPMSKWEDA